MDPATAVETLIDAAASLETYRREADARAQTLECDFQALQRDFQRLQHRQLSSQQETVRWLRAIRRSHRKHSHRVTSQLITQVLHLFDPKTPLHLTTPSRTERT
jgi:cell fate (sporulation/competence/biofilm development) regulator YlbF (YheA/YmcA/DUF963 family)